MKPSREKWFLALTFVLMVLIFVPIADRVFERVYVSKIPKYDRYSKRVIALREPALSQRAEIKPHEEIYRVYADGLADRSWRVDTDEQGLWLPSRTHDKPDMTIIFFGGSTTACEYVDGDKRFAYLTGRILESKTGKKINSLNAGVSGNTSLDSINSYTNKFIPYRADVVVLMHAWNDLVGMLFEGTLWNDNPTRGNLRTIVTESEQFSRGRNVLRALKNVYAPNLWDHLVRPLYETPVTDEFARTRGRKLVYDIGKLKADFARNLRHFVAITRIHGSHPVLMTQQNRLKDTPDPKIRDSFSKLSIQSEMTYQELKVVYDGINQTIRDVARETGAELVDLDRVIPKEREYIYDIMHFNERGSELAAQEITRVLEPVIRKLRAANDRESNRAARTQAYASSDSR